MRNKIKKKSARFSSEKVVLILVHFPLIFFSLLFIHSFSFDDQNQPEISPERQILV